MAPGMNTPSTRPVLRSTAQRRARGSIIINTAIALSLIVITLVGAELGYLFYLKRELQKTADLAALAGAQKLFLSGEANACDSPGGPETAAHANAAKNFTGVVLTEATCGHWEPTKATPSNTECFVGTDDHFIPRGSPENAFRVRINKTPDSLFSFFAANRKICVQAVAALNEPQASFSVGSGVARLNEGALNRLLSLLLGTTVNLSIADYTGLANAKVNLLGIADALNLNVGTYDQLATTNLTLAQLLTTTIQLLPRDNDSKTVELVANALDGILKLSGGLNLDEASVHLLRTAEHAGLLDLDLNTLDPRNALSGNISALNLLSVALQVANSQAAIGASASIPLEPLANVTVQAKVIEPPTIAVGAPGFYQPGSIPKTQAHTGQIRVALNIRALTGAGGSNDLLNIGLLRVSMPAGQLLNLPIYVEVASGDAKLKEVSCNAADGKYDVIIDSAPGLAHVFLGHVPNGFNNKLISWADLPKEKFKLLSLQIDILGSILTDPITVELLARLDLSIPENGTIGRKDLKYRFDPSIPASEQALIQSVGLEQNLGAAIGSAISRNLLNVQLKTSGLGLAGNILDALANGLVTILRGVLSVLMTTLTPLLNLLDLAVLGPLLKTLGIQLGYADVQLFSASCQGSAKLVY